MHVLIQVDWYYPIGGAEVFVENLVRHLGSDVRITLSVCSVGQKSGPAINRSNVEVVDLSGRPWKICNLIASLQPDIVHTNNLGVHGLLAGYAASRYGIGLVHTNHTVWPKRPGRNVRRKAGGIIRRATQNWLISRCHVGITPSQIVADILEKQGTTCPLRLISCGVDDGFFMPGDPLAARERLGLDETPTFLYVGRLAKGKGLELLLEAMHILRTRGLECRLLIAGPNTVRSSAAKGITALISKLNLADAVTQLGYIPYLSEQQRDLYLAADVFVMPSYFETLSIATLEAMATECPVVVSDAGALPELVAHGANGIVFPKGDAVALADSLGWVIQNAPTAIEMGKNGRLVAERHSIAQTAETYTQLYRELIERGNAK